MKKSEKENKILIIIAICLSLLIVILTIIFQVLLPKLNQNSLQETDKFVPNNELSAESIYKPSENEWIKLQLSGEESRVKYYIGTFINKFIGDEKYDYAYEVLSSGFKANYFETYEKFVEYAKEKYTTSPVLKYGEFQREGNLYIMEVTIGDFKQEKETFTQTFIVKENDFNDYEIAFNV